MDEQRARELLGAERQRVTTLLSEMTEDAGAAHATENQAGDWDDRAQPLTTEGTTDAVVVELQQRLESIGRAEARLASGTYGRSVRSGTAIPDDRLQADPAAELTVEEAADLP